MIEFIRRLLDEMDAELSRIARPGERLDLYPIGRAVLSFQYGARGVVTRDLDIVWMRDSVLEERAAVLFGKGSRKAEEIGIYLDLVPQGLPPVPQRFRGRCGAVAGSWDALRLWVLEPNDYAATKLKSFRPQDRQDLQFLCDAGLLHPEELTASLQSAYAWSMEKDGDEEREKAFAHLKRVIAYLEGQIPAL